MTAPDPLGGLRPPPGAPPQRPGQPRPRRKPPPTPTAWLLCAVLTGFFLAQCALAGGATDDPLALFRLGALHWVAVLDGDWWRLGAYSFLHIGVPHFVLNLVALFILMRLVESAFGSVSALGIYALSVLAGGAASMLAERHGQQLFLVSAGASAGIAGLFGAYGAAWLRVRKVIPPEVARATQRMLLLNLGLNLLLAAGAGFYGVELDNQAHIGGVIAGFLGGLLAPLPILPRRVWSRPAQGALVLAAFALAAMEGAAVSRAVNPHLRWLIGTATIERQGPPRFASDTAPGADVWHLQAESPWMLVPLPGKVGVAVSPGGIGMEAEIAYSAQPPQIVAGSEAIRLGDTTWLRRRESGEHEGEEIQILSAPHGKGSFQVKVLCSSEVCRGALADDTALRLARTLVVRFKHT